MPNDVAAALRRLERLRTKYGNRVADDKLQQLRILDRRRFPRAKEILRLHEVLCFMRAYPDNEALLNQVQRMLAGFAERSDLRRHRHDLSDSGIRGTAINFSFFAPTANWLAHRWGKFITIDWEVFEQAEKLDQLLPLLALYCETLGLDDLPFEVREWVDHLKGPDETDAAFLLKRLDQLRMSPLIRETIYEDLDIPLILSPGPDTPARTGERIDGFPVVYQSAPLRRARPSVAEEVARPPRSIHSLPPRRAQEFISLARSAMVTRARDLYTFQFSNSNDVHLADCGDGLQVAFIGTVPERRLLLETICAFIVLKNGVLIGYGANTALFGSSEVAYTVFDTFRSGEAAWMYCRVLATVTRMFGSNTFMIDTYQLGEDNDDALRSGAWWFYQKLGYRPRDSRRLAIMEKELCRMKKNRSHRSSRATLKKLVTAYVYLHLGRARDDVLGVMPLANVGLRITQYLAKRFGFDRRRATIVCARQAAELVGLRSLRTFSRGERLAWERWSPLILILPNVACWTREDKRALVAVVRAKGGRHESDYVLRFDKHQRLRRAIRALAEAK